MPIKNDDTTPACESGDELPVPAPEQRLAQSLDEIARILRRMLTLAELSSSDMDVDRRMLQQTFERLKDEVERIADGM